MEQEGLNISPTVWGVYLIFEHGVFYWRAPSNGKMCPLGHLLEGSEAKSNQMAEDAAALLGETKAFCVGFISGFDRFRFVGASLDSDYTRGFALGEEARTLWEGLQSAARGDDDSIHGP